MGEKEGKLKVSFKGKLVQGLRIVHLLMIRSSPAQSINAALNKKKNKRATLYRESKRSVAGEKDG